MSISSINDTFWAFAQRHAWQEASNQAMLSQEAWHNPLLPSSAQSLLAAKAFLQKGITQLYLLDDKEQAMYALGELEELLGKENLLFFPSSYLQPYQVEATQNANIVLRTEVLNALSSATGPKLIVSYAQALAEKVMQPADFKAMKHLIKKGDRLDFEFMRELLHHFGFEAVDFVSQPGEFSVRGGIVDVFSYAYEQPFRLSFFSDEVESIKRFNIETQLSEKAEDFFELVSNITQKSESKKVSLLHLLPKNHILFCQNAYLCQNIIKDFHEKAEKSYAQLNKDIKHSLPEELFVSEIDFIKDLQMGALLDFTSQKMPFSKGSLGIDILPQPIFHKNFNLLIEDLEQKLAQGFKLFISFSSDKQKDRLEAIFNDLGKHIIFEAFTSELHQGFIDPQHKILVYTDHQIFDRYQRYKAKNAFAKSEQLSLKDLMSLKVGDYITHIDHGIGKFMGLVKVNNNGKFQECFKLTYKNNDLLYVSIHALHKISKYNGSEGREIVLSKIGAPAWKLLTQKTKVRVKQLAFDLIKLYAQRKTATGFSYSPDGYLQNELEASFMYEDTPDQEKATADIKKDMEGQLVMDRLICGDVGFGKTEVAIRAAFKAACDGKQVAILVPTTILAFQHFRSFSKRLKDFPVNVSYINRFRSAKQKKEVLEGLENGKIDIVIGTHQLVSPSIKFKDLGLLIIDEEHKFGVGIKEKLKTIKTDVDTLTLTATPIPRTLQFSLMAARDLSVIKTPPPNRQPVETEMLRFNEEAIRDAISYELQRDGQVYFINNRIENLKDIAGMIQRLVPDARVLIGHGQMDGKQLEQNMMDFMEGRYDVLVATTIVESGLDVPNANTIFINDAHRFGMADLHQMRGRVGRSNRKAFCKLITSSFDLLTSDARKRLEAMIQFSDLGSGFQIAMKDLEIRGAGDLLGAEQSGFINEMGFEAYQKIIQEALEELKDEDLGDLIQSDEDRQKIFNFQKEVNIDSDMEMMLPDEYVSSTEERLSLYQRLAELKNHEELMAFGHELSDRFGTLPTEAINMLKSIELKWLAAEIGFEKIVMKNGVFLGYFPSHPQDKFYSSNKFQHIMSYLKEQPKEASLKQKGEGENTQLMLRKEKITAIDQVNQLLVQITVFMQGLAVSS